MGCITEILKLKGDREVLVPDGGWIAIEGGGTYKDYEYIIVLNATAQRCGYVALPPEHPYSQKPPYYAYYDCASLDIDVHGGLTFMATDSGLKDLLPTPSNEIWIGFDCGHWRDMCDVEMFKKYFGEEEFQAKKLFFECMDHSYLGQTVKQYDYVEQQCHHVIDQLIQVAA